MIKVLSNFSSSFIFNHADYALKKGIDRGHCMQFQKENSPSIKVNFAMTATKSTRDTDSYDLSRLLLQQSYDNY